MVQYLRMFASLANDIGLHRFGSQNPWPVAHGTFFFKKKFKSI